MGMFNKTMILQPAKLRRERVKLPEFGDDVYIIIRALSAKESDSYLDDKNGSERQISDYDLLALCVVDDDGKPVFDDAKDAAAHLDIALESRIRLVKKILELSGIDARDRSKN